MIDFRCFGDCVYFFRHVGKANLANRMIDPGNPLEGIDKLTCRRGLALPDRGLDVLYSGASAHSECVLTANYAGYFHVPIAELVYLSIPSHLLEDGHPIITLH